MEAYLTFDGNAAEALAFYAQALGGKVVHSMSYGDSPACADMPGAAKDKIMHAMLEARGHRLMDSDAPPGHPFAGYKGFSLSVQAKDVAEGEKLFQALSVGSKITMPFAPTFWSTGFGMLEDKFGVSWMVNVDQAP